MDNYNFLIGERFNRLVIKTVFRDSSGYIRCSCVCDCGSKKDNVLLKKLKSGSTKSCGCLRREMALQKTFKVREDLTGKKFGRLTVIRFIERDNNRNQIWECKCDCGNITNAKASRLKLGKKLSCGCLLTDYNARLLDKIGVKDSTRYSALNDSLYSNNTSNVRGVSYSKSKRKWIAYIHFKKKYYYLGIFDFKEDAVSVRKRAEDILWGSVQSDVDSYLAGLKKNKTMKVG